MAGGEREAYNAPYPDDSFKAGARMFPELVRADCACPSLCIPACAYLLCTRDIHMHASLCILLVHPCAFLSCILLHISYASFLCMIMHPSCASLRISLVHPSYASFLCILMHPSYSSLCIFTHISYAHLSYASFSCTSLCASFLCTLLLHICLPSPRTRSRHRRPTRPAGPP